MASREHRSGRRSAGDGAADGKARGASDANSPQTPSADQQALARAHSRIAELEAELLAAKTTVHALLDNVEGNFSGLSGGASSGDGGDPPASTSSPAARSGDRELEQLIRQRTRALVESEKQLHYKTTELERLNEMKVEFISIATHELRTPLTSIVGYLDLLEEGGFGDVPKSMERPMASLRRNAHRLKRLVDEMLDVSRIDSGRVTLYRTRCDLSHVIRDVVADLKPQASAKRQQLDAVIEEAPEIYADLEKARQVAHKVVANAIRHTPEAGVITVTLDTAPPDRFAGVWARIRVKGTGINIPSDMRSRIFEPFSSLHKAKHHTSAGPDAAGLGLYIARGLVDLHGGLISMDSVDGEYTEFIVLLPESEPTEVADG